MVATYRGGARSTSEICLRDLMVYPVAGLPMRQRELVSSAGGGVIVTELAFLESTAMTCEVCNGTVFNEIALGYYFDNRNISELMAMPVDQVASFFTDPDAGKMLECLRHVGLRYLTIGRSTSILSGGERQRVKLASVLDEDVDILILAEPTTGLHGIPVIDCDQRTCRTRDNSFGGRA